MTDAPDIFAETGLKGLEEVTGRLIRSYASMVGSMSSPNEDVPDYVWDLMGYNRLRSFVMHRPGFVSQVIDEDAIHVGRVVDTTHDVFRQVWRDNIRFDRNVFPPPGISELLKADDTKEFFTRQQEFEERFGNVVPWNEAPEDLRQKRNEIIGGIFDQLDLGGVSTIPMFVGEDNIPVSIENVLVRVPNIDPRKLARGDVPTPIAGVVWALSLAGTKLLGRPYGNVMSMFIGVQESIPTHMRAAFQLIDDAFPEGDSLYNHLVIDGPKVAQAITEEAHHLKVADIAATIGRHSSRGTIGNGFSHALSLVGQSSDDLTLKTEHAARDTAILLYKTSDSLVRTLEMLKSQGTGAAMMYAAGFSSGRRNDMVRGFALPLQVVTERLEQLADTIAAMGEGTTVEKIGQEISKDRDNVKVLRDAWDRAKELDTRINSDDKTSLGIGIQFVGRDILPRARIAPSSIQLRPQARSEGQITGGMSRAERRRQRQSGGGTEPRGL